MAPNTDAAKQQSTQDAAAAHDDEALLPEDPLLIVQRQHFLLSHGGGGDAASASAARDEIKRAIVDNNASPFVRAFPELQAYVGGDGGGDAAAAQLRDMDATNARQLDELDAKIKDAEENLGESEVREAYLAKAKLLHRIGDKDAALAEYRKAESKTVALGQKLDLVFAALRIAFVWQDVDLLKRSIEKAKGMIEQGGDWERRNRLKVYEGLYLLCVRQFKQAAQLFLESIATFSSTELLSYNQFIYYSIVAAMISLERTQIKKKIIDSPEVLSVLGQLPHNVGQFVNSLYECRYADFFVALADVVDGMRFDRYLAPHVRFYTRELKVRAYKQFLEPYKSVTLQSMAQQFNVSADYVDRDLARFIATDRIHCKIDKVNDVVETARVDERSSNVQRVLKEGDLLLSRLARLSRVIDM